MSKESQAKFFNGPKYIKVAKKIGSFRQRWLARLNGKSDGKIALYGPPTFDQDFENRCQWLQEKMQHAERNQAEAEEEVLVSQRLVELKKRNLSEDLTKRQEEMTAITQEAGRTFCKRPVLPFPFKIAFFVLMFFLELLFTVVAMYGSGRGTQAQQIGLALFAAMILVALTDTLGGLIRELPLASNVTVSASRRHRFWIVTATLLLIIVLVGINYVRSGPSGAEGGAGQQLPGWLFLILGACLALVGVLLSHTHEYSGPKYGLAKHERRQKFLKREIAKCDASLQRLADFTAKLERIAHTNIRTVFSIYAGQYKKQSILQERIATRE